jgi:hypothetical protein
MEGTTGMATTLKVVSEATWPIAIRYLLRGRPTLRLVHEAYWDTHGFALLDGIGEEHHFGFPERAGSTMLFSFVASYTDEGRETGWAGAVHDELVERGYELVDPSRGPDLSPLTIAALEDLADFATHKGFAFDPERERAVKVFGALRLAGEPFDPGEVWVWGATHGFRPKDADMMREYARRAIEGGGTRTVSGHAIRVDRVQADRMVEHWRREIDEQ